jgi:hypothetical protein
MWMIGCGDDHTKYGVITPTSTIPTLHFSTFPQMIWRKISALWNFPLKTSKH